MLLRELFEAAPNDQLASDAKELVAKVADPSTIRRVSGYLRNILQKINPGNDHPQPEIQEGIDHEKEFAINAIEEIAKSGNVKQLNAVISFLRGAELKELAHAGIAANISQGVRGNLDDKLSTMVQQYNAPFEQKEEFLTKMASGTGFWDGTDLLKNPTGNIYTKLQNIPVLGPLAKKIALDFRGAMGYGPDQGPGEFLLALTGQGVDLAEKSDLVLVDGQGVEVKADSKVAKSRAGGRLYSTSGYGTAGTARISMYSKMIELGVPKEVLATYGWPKKTKGQSVPMGGLNFNIKGIGNLNGIFKEYLGQDGAKQVLAAMLTGLYTDLPTQLGSAFVNVVQADGSIDAFEANKELIALAHEYYKEQEGHEFIMVFNTNTGDYVMIRDGNDVRNLIDNGKLKYTAMFDFFDDRSKGSPQLLTGNLA